MNYSVKGVKNFRGMEGNGYNATLLRDGVPVALAIDDATGGEVRIEWNDWKAPRVDVNVHNWKDEPHTFKGTPEEKLFREWCDGRTTTFDGTTMRSNAGMEIGRMIDELGLEKTLRRWCKTMTVFRLKGDKEGEYRTLKCAYNPETKKVVVTKYGDKVEEIVNERFTA